MEKNVTYNIDGNDFNNLLRDLKLKDAKSKPQTTTWHKINYLQEQPL